MKNNIQKELCMNEIQAISKNHEIIKLIKQLNKQSKPDDLYLVEDITILAILKEKQITLEYFIYVKERDYKETTKDIINYFLKHSKNIYTISEKTFLSLENKENHIGFLAIVKKEKKQLSKINDEIVLVIDRLENAGNIGTILRTADSAGIKTIIEVDQITNPNHPKLIQSSRGTVFSLDIYEMTYEEAQKLLLNNNYEIYLGEPNLGKSYDEYEYLNKTAIVIGSERFGINPKWYQNPHKKVFIPMYGILNSLNVGVAGAILMYDVKQKKEKRR